MHACKPADAQSSSVLDVGHTMAEWSVMDCEWPPDGSYNPYAYGVNPYYQDMRPYYPPPPPPHAHQLLPPPPKATPPSPSPALTLLLSPPHHQSPTQLAPGYADYAVPRGDNPREIRNKAEKQRRDKLNLSISELASMVPPVVAANRKIDKTGILRLTAHYLRAHQYVFGDSIGQSSSQFNPAAAQALLSLLKGFLLTTTYKGLVVVVSQNVQQYLGYTELDLLGQNVFNMIHPDDHQILRENLMPKSHLLGPNGELLIPDGPEGGSRIAQELAGEKRRFMVRFKKHSQRSEPVQYVKCYVEGTLRKSDRACRGYNRCCQVVRRARARGENPCSSGNDVVFIGLVRPNTETFMAESHLESFRMEYRTRHSVDGEIVDVEPRIAIVTGYMSHEVNGVNAMNFIHRDDVRWVIFNLREMYDQHRLVGESCYRLIAKNGQIIYMKTVGRLDVDEDSRAVRSFACINTVVDEQEGKHLIKLMKKKCMVMVNNNGSPIMNMEVTHFQNQEDQSTPFEDPRNLEKVILHLVTDLPSVHPNGRNRYSTDSEDSTSLPLAIIPPKKERILGAIERIYDVVNNLSTTSMHFQPIGRGSGRSPRRSPRRSPQPREPSPARNRLPSRLAETSALAQFRLQLEGLGDTTLPPQSLGHGFSTIHHLRPEAYTSADATPSTSMMNPAEPRPSTSVSPSTSSATHDESLESSAKKVKRESEMELAADEGINKGQNQADNEITAENTDEYQIFDETILDDPFLNNTIRSLDITSGTLPELLVRDVTSIIAEMEEEQNNQDENQDADQETAL